MGFCRARPRGVQILFQDSTAPGSWTPRAGGGHCAAPALTGVRSAEKWKGRRSPPPAPFVIRWVPKAGAVGRRKRGWSQRPEATGGLSHLLPAAGGEGEAGGSQGGSSSASHQAKLRLPVGQAPPPRRPSSTHQQAFPAGRKGWALWGRVAVTDTAEGTSCLGEVWRRRRGVGLGLWEHSRTVTPVFWTLPTEHTDRG